MPSRPTDRRHWAHATRCLHWQKRFSSSRSQMKRSSDRILTTHAGALEQPQNLKQAIGHEAGGELTGAAAASVQLELAVSEVVRKQVECGLDVVNDGEF